MERDDGLELSLGLSCGGSNPKPKGKDGGSPDVQILEGGDLNVFLNPKRQKHDAYDGSQRSNVERSGPEASKGSFFTNLVNPVHAAEAASPRLECWDAKNKSKEVEEVKFGKGWHEAAGNKHKMLFEEMKQQKKHGREIQCVDVCGANNSPAVSTSARTSFIAEDASGAENEDVSKSQVQGSTQWLVMHHKDGTKQFMVGNCGYPEFSRERYGQKQSNALPESDPRFGSITYGMSNAAQYSSKMSGINGESNTSTVPSPRVMQLNPPAANVGPDSHTPNSCNLSLTLGYSARQLDIFSSERSCGLTPHSSYAGRNIGNGVPNSDRSENSSNISRGNVQAAAQGSSVASLDVRKTSEMAKGSGVENNLLTTRSVHPLQPRPKKA